jgi:hypothetical protein
MRVVWEPDVIVRGWYSIRPKNASKTRLAKLVPSRTIMG